MNRSRPIALAGLGAALLCNYWVLEAALADRHDFQRSWISDLAARTEPSGWRFQALAVLSGLAVAGFAALLLRRPAPAPRARLLRLGLLALLAVGAFATVAGAASLSCPEGLERSCTLAEDPVDAIHALATGGEIVATALAFLLVGLALLSPQQRGRPLGRGPSERPAALGMGWATLAIGVAWVAIAALTGVSFIGEDFDAVRGALQRAGQVLFGIWLALLGLWWSVTLGVKMRVRCTSSAGDRSPTTPPHR